jgi:hypothetical protein
MSVLDDFLRIRLYRKQAAEFQWQADNARDPSVQRRYRSIARHYSDLADREEQADKRRMVERLEQIKRERQERPVPGRRLVLPSHHANDNLPIGLLRLMQVYERVRRTRAVQRSRGEIFVKGPKKL